MREGIGATVLYNMIIIFIFIVFTLLLSSLTYYKAFRVNNMILYSIDKFEGYNNKAIEDINRQLSAIGYAKNTDNSICPQRDNMNALKNEGNDNYYYCVYYYSNDTGGNDRGVRNDDNQPLYYNYSVVTYIYVDLPLINKFKIPVHTKGERIYNFSDEQAQEGGNL